MRTCTAPTTTAPSALEPDGDPDFEHGWSCDWTAATGDGCSAEPPAGCSGPTTWPPLTAWERWALERAAGIRVPPSVSVWTERDVQRQQEAHELAQPAPVVDDPPARRPIRWGSAPMADYPPRAGRGCYAEAFARRGVSR